MTITYEYDREKRISTMVDEETGVTLVNLGVPYPMERERFFEVRFEGKAIKFSATYDSGESNVEEGDFEVIEYWKKVWELKLLNLQIFGNFDISQLNNLSLKKEEIIDVMLKLLIFWRERGKNRGIIKFQPRNISHSYWRELS